jgi:RNA polymerase sigma-70 factor, ECF subfamily
LAPDEAALTSIESRACTLMSASEDRPVTQLLAQWRSGDETALAQLTVLLYGELRRLAQQHLRGERADHTIQRTALVNEAFVRLVRQQSVEWRDRSHFFALASKLMRRILVDHARARSASKRGGGLQKVSLDELDGAVSDDSVDAGIDACSPAELRTHDLQEEDVAALDEMLSQLEAIDPRQAQIVEMRYFGGLTIEQTAQALDVSDATVKREWTLARAWLRRELTRAGV